MQPTDVSIFSLVWQQFWQCSVLVLTVWLVCQLVRFKRSHLTCLLWLVVLLKFITPPVWDSSMGLFCWIQNGLPAKVSPSLPPDKPEFLTRTESTRLLTGDDMGKLPDVSANPDFKVTIHENETSRQTPVRSETTTIPVQPTAENIGQPAAHYSVKEMGVVIWMTVGLLIATVMLVRYLRCWHIIRRAGEQSHPELNRLLARLCSELKLKRRVRLLITHSRMGPAVIGLLRPTIILPTAITESRSLAELEPVLAHELIHIRRGDLWIGLLQLLASVVWWFHPLVWFTGRRLKFEIEQCCDEEVLAELNCDPRQYAACLLEILELKQTLKAVPVVPGVRPVEITSKRLERIMRLGQGCQKRTPWWCWMIFVTLAAVVLPGAAFVVSAAEQAEEQLPHSNKEERAGSLNSVKDPIQPLPFYDPIKRATNSNNLFSRSYSRDLAYLSAEIDMRDWISRSVCTREYSIKELLDKTSKNMGPMRAEAVLKEKLHARLKLLREFAAVNERPDYSTSIPVYCETHQIPLKDERKQCRMVSYGGSCIRDDRLIVWAKDERYHKLVEQALDELSREEMTPFVLTAKFISVPRGLLEKLSSERRQVKVYQAEKTAVVSDAAAGEQPELIGPETISHPSLICEILDEKRVREVQRIIKSSTDTQTISAPQVRFIDGQTVQLETKKRHELEPRFRGAGQSYSVKNYDVGLDLRVTFSTGKGIQNRGMLDYQITSSEYAGLKKQKLNHSESGLAGEIEFPVITEWQFKDARLLKPGEVLLVEGLGLQQEADSPNVLLALFQVDRARADERKPVMWGEGVDSEAGVTGKNVLDESHYKDALVTNANLVADLVQDDSSKSTQASGESETSSLLPPDNIRRHYSLVDLLSAARNVVRRERSRRFLLQQIKTRISELSDELSDTQLSEKVEGDTLSEIQTRKKMNGDCFLLVNDLVVDSTDPVYHRIVKQVLAEFSGNTSTRIKMTTTFVCLTQSAFESWELDTKPIKYYSSKQALAEQFGHFCHVETYEPERVYNGVLYQYIQDQAEGENLRRRFREAGRQKKFAGTVSGSVLMSDGQMIRMTKKMDFKYSSIDDHIDQERGFLDSEQVLELKVNYHPSGGGHDHILLDYKVATFYIEAKKNLTHFDPETQEKKQIETPLMQRLRFQNTTSIKPGQTLLVGGLPVTTKRKDPFLLGLLLTAEPVQIPSRWLMVDR